MSFERFRRLLPAAALALAAMVAAPPPAFSQTGAGVLEGAITDADGGALPGVTVTLSNAATGYSRVDSSGADGRYRFAAVPIGDFQVKFELSGFATLTQEAVPINVGSTRTLDVTLQVASVEEANVATTRTRGLHRDIPDSLDSEGGSRNSFSDPGEAAPPPWRSRSGSCPPPPA